MNNSSLGTLGLAEPALPTPAWEAQERRVAWCHLWSPQHHLGSLPPSTGCEGGLGKVKTSAAQEGPSVFVLHRDQRTTAGFCSPRLPSQVWGRLLPSSLHLLQTQHVSLHGAQLLLCGLTVQSHGLSSHLVTAVPTVCLFSTSFRH